ncbi:hypothetical protein LAZ67_13001533 [Cordylochernes scorpioides]|uniref:Reverse transcriptase domain-containing protein n=1 Tax=Cordylochernes scorpioides TaxID=51811 RepID=A0ABY6L7E0_9ARAC|nr:hypothetical protein LAZ67_13001533 [Cordylochernes scorpioides]
MADLLQSITRDIRLQKNDITQRHNSKLHHWIKKYNFPAYLLEAYLPQSPQGVVNLSDYVLPSADAEILSLGLKYRLPGPSDIPRIIAGVEPALRGLNHQDTHRIRHFVTSTLQRPYNIPKPSLAMNRVISRLKRNRDIVITKSDKGSQTVILNTTVYKQKMQNVLDQHSIFSAITEQEHKTSVKNFRLLLLRLKRSQQITKEQYNDFTANLAQIAYIYGLPKIHKPDVPLRPIISYHLSPAYTLSKFLSNFLTPLLQSPPWEYTIANSPSFVSYITSLTPPPRSIMVSFDVTSLYLSLAHPLIISNLRTFLENAPLLDTLTAETVVELTSICLGMSTFTFDTQFFKQTKGSPMGSPLSTVVAEVVMRSLDQWITSRHSSDIFLWRRYIDDTFCLVSEVSASHILSDLNSFHPDIAFTHETENHSIFPSCEKAFSGGTNDEFGRKNGETSCFQTRKEYNVSLDRLKPANLLKESYPEDDDLRQQPEIQQDLQLSKARTQKIHFEEPHRTRRDGIVFEAHREYPGLQVRQPPDYGKRLSDERVNRERAKSNHSPEHPPP